jgi:hypothetical protein
MYLANGGTLEKAQLMAGHADPRTTKLYDRTSIRGEPGRGGAGGVLARDPGFRGEGTGCKARRTGSRPYLRC